MEENKRAFYIGGNTSHNGESVYLVNCNISAVGNRVVSMNSSTPVQNLYMSGCTFNNTSASQYIGVDNTSSMKLYFGLNNNFGLISNIYNNSSTIPFATAKENGVITDVNADYWRIVSPDD